MFVQAGIAVALVNAMVVSVFSLLGERDIRGVLELWLASAAAGAGSAVAAAGSFAVLGTLFGIITVFQLLELANPSQPLLRRLLVETPGTYHHSLMVGNLAERAAEAIGADPLLTRVAAYYHDVGKLANPLAFIENQAGGENVHDQLDPETSAQVLKQHVADGIDIAYKARLPKPLIAFIPQHHGTAIMSYFYGRAKDLAAEPYGGIVTGEGQKAAAAVDQRRFRHAGPKPQSREAALIMLADGVEASVRSLSSRDEPAIRAMVARILDERVSDNQFDECELTLRDLAAHPRGLRRPAPRHVPHADRVPGEQGRRARIAACRERRRRRQRLVSRHRIGGWRIDVERRESVPRIVPAIALARTVGRALEGGRAPTPASIALVLSDDRELAELNASHMGHEGPTDVLSFPLLPPEVFRSEGAVPTFALPPGRLPHLGDIVVSVERAIEQAESGRGGHTGDVRWSAADELRLLVTHGTLHVCGWDHAEPAEEAAMRALERELLGQLARPN